MSPSVALIAWIGLAIFDGYLTLQAGGNRRAVAGGAVVIAVALSAVVVLGPPLGIIVGVSILGLMIGGRQRWVRVIGMRPDVGMWHAYRAIYASRQLERTAGDAAARERAHARLLAKLNDLDRWRSPETTRLIDLLRESYALQTSAVSRDEDRRVAVELDAELVRLWGPLKERR